MSAAWYNIRSSALTRSLKRRRDESAGAGCVLATHLCRSCQPRVTAARMNRLDHVEALRDHNRNGLVIPLYRGRPARMLRVAGAIWSISTAGCVLATATKCCSAIQYPLYPHVSACCASSLMLCRSSFTSSPALIGAGSRTDGGISLMILPNVVL